MLKVNNLKAGYTDENILEGVNLEVNEGDIIVVVGKNGSGKSTLARSIMNLVTNIDGDLSFNNHDIYDRETFDISDKGIAYYKQGGRIFPNLSVSENIVFASIKNGKRINKQQYNNLAQLFPVMLYRNKKASELSGGERSTLALAMLMVREPDFLILDEPSSGLDSKNIQNSYNLIQEMIKKKMIKSIIIIEQKPKQAIDISKLTLRVKDKKIDGQISSGSLDNDAKINEFMLK